MDAVSVGFLVKALGYGIPGAMLVFTLLVLPVVLKSIRAKQDKDRREHMAKWESMVQVQREAIEKQKQTSDAIIQTHHMEIERILDSHREENDRSYRLYERQAQSMEAMAHNLSVMSQTLEQKHFCPKE